MIAKVSLGDPALIRLLADDPRFVNAKLCEAEPSGHAFQVGETRELVGLESFPEFNGQMVEIEAIREDGPNGRAYYIKGEINRFLNWTYEYRLK